MNPLLPSGIFFFGFMAGAASAWFAADSKRRAMEIQLHAELNYMRNRGPRQWMLDENIHAGIAHAQSRSVIEYDLGMVEIRNDGETPIDYWMKFDTGRPP